MSFHALLPSPLGDILLTAGTLGLRGLHFTDQRDCPSVPGLPSPTDIVSQPSAGLMEGRATRRLKAVRANKTTEGELFEPDDAAPRAMVGQAVLRPLQADTPADVLAVLEQTRQELDEYWRGKRQVFDVRLDPQGTRFQQQIWQALLAVSCGTTLSYGELGRQAGLGAGHGRAVGMAVGSNPISIIIPCHRILAHNGTLNGYGGGLSRKIRLLEIEGFRIQA